MHLDKGSHASREEGLCIMEAVAYVAGEPHSDHPRCACPVIAAFARRLNDRMSDTERQRLVAYIPRLVGSRATRTVERHRAYVAADFAVRDAAVRALRSARRTADANKLARLPPIVDRATAEGARAAAADYAAAAAADNAAAAYAAYAACAAYADNAHAAAAAAAAAATAAATAYADDAYATAYATAAAAAASDIPSTRRKWPSADDDADDAAARLGARGVPSPGDRWAPALACLDRMLAVPDGD
jgi:hypothetical protein